MDVTLIGNGINSNVETQVDPSRQALRASPSPLEWNWGGVQGGHYNLCATTGIITALAASAQIFAVRWNDPTKLFLLLRLAASATTTLAAAGHVGVDLEGIRASSYTVNSAGAQRSAIAPSTVSQMARQTSMAPSSFNSAGEIATVTTAALTAGTQTLDTAGFGAVQIPGLGASVIGNAGGLFDIFNCLIYGQHPLVFVNNQGFVVRTPSGLVASCSMRFSITMSWMEVAAF